MMNVVSKDAQPTIDYLASAFKKPEYDARISDTKYDFFYPISGVNNSCLRWTIPHNMGRYVPNMEKMILAPEIRITNRAKSDRPTDDIKSGPCNNFINSIFGSLLICYNTTCVLKIDHYPIYNLTRLKLNNDDNDLKTWAENRCFYKEDEDEDLDKFLTKSMKKRSNCFGTVMKEPATINGEDNPNKALDGKFRYSKTASFFLGTLDHFLPQPAILKNIDVHIELDLSSPKYVFQSEDDTLANTDINFEFERCRLFVPFIKLNDQLYLQPENRLKNDAMRQFFTSTQIDTHAISTGDKTATFSSIAPGQYPSRLWILLQETDRLQGKYSLNSLKFSRKLNDADPFRVDSLSVTINNQEVEGLAMDNATNSFKDKYFRLFHLTNMDNGKNACSITFKEFKNSCCWLVYDFTSTLNGTEPPMLPLLSKGNLRVQLNFNRPTTCALTMVTMVELQSSLTYDNNGKITLSSI